MKKSRKEKPKPFKPPNIKNMEDIDINKLLKIDQQFSSPAQSDLNSTMTDMKKTLSKLNKKLTVKFDDQFNTKSFKLKKVVQDNGLTSHDVKKHSLSNLASIL